jgi:ATP-dependent Clp protease ATP-binding subunit ClpA
MSETGQRICRLAEEAANAVEPRDALRTLHELRRELEDFERQQAARALTAGESFGAVARSLGISRQAAHRRFRDLAPRGPDDGTERPTPEARLAVEYAREEAEAAGAAAVRSEHLLLGVLRNGDERAASVLRDAGVTLDDARAVAGDPAVAAAARAADGEPPGRRAVHAALLAARRHQAGTVGVEHLLLGVLDDDRDGAATVLRRLGVAPETVRARVDALAGAAHALAR